MIIYLRSVSLPEEMRMTHVLALKSGSNISSHAPSAQSSSNIRTDRTAQLNTSNFLDKGRNPIDDRLNLERTLTF